MLGGNRVRKATHIAKKRFKQWYPDYDPNEPIWKKFSKESVLGSLRKTNVRCSCHSCRNPRRSMFSNNKEKLTIQERKDLERVKHDLQNERGII